MKGEIITIETAQKLAEYDKLKQQYKKQKEVIDKAIKTLEFGINTYNNGGSRTALFEVISDSKNMLEEVSE